MREPLIQVVPAAPKPPSLLPATLRSIVLSTTTILTSLWKPPARSTAVLLAMVVPVMLTSFWTQKPPPLAAVLVDTSELISVAAPTELKPPP